MTRVPSESDNIDRGWQQTAPEGRTRRGLYAWRAFVSILFLVAFAGLLYFLLPSPTTHWLVLQSNALRVLDGPAVPVGGKELDLLEPLTVQHRGIFRRSYEWLYERLFGSTDQLTPTHDQLLASPQALDGISKSLEELPKSIDDSDRLIVYVAAHGVSYQGRPYLVCNNFDPAEPLDGLVDVSVLLSAMNHIEADTKLLILDAGQLDYDPGMGIVANDFPRLLQEAAQKTQDNNLRVLCSHSSGQRSHKSPVLGVSLFGMYVVEGLRGAADGVLDKDGKKNESVTINELTKFVTASLAAEVPQSLSKGAAQTPMLVTMDTSGGDPELLSTGRFEPTLDEGESQQLVRHVAARVPRGGEPEASAPATRGYLARLAEPNVQAGPPSAAPNAKPSGEGAAVAGEKSAASEAAPEDSETTPEEAAEEANRQLRALLDLAWRVRDELAGATGDADPLRLRPVDVAPHLWRELQEELIGYEQILLGGDQAAITSTVERLKATLAKFWVPQNDQQVLVHDLVQIKAGQGQPRAVPAPIEMRQLKSLALADFLADQFVSDTAAQIDALRTVLDGLVDANPDELAAKLAELKPTADFDRYYELRLVKPIVTAGNIEPSLALLALQARRDGEKVAAAALWDADWLLADVAAADRLRLAGERHMLDQIGSGWQSQAREFLQRAMDRYTEAAAKREVHRRTVRLRNDLVFRAPYYVRAQRDAASTDAVAAFLARLNELCSALDDPDEYRANQIAQLSADLTGPPGSTQFCGNTSNSAIARSPR
jgi:hypothetical protein